MHLIKKTAALCLLLTAFIGGQTLADMPIAPNPIKKLLSCRGPGPAGIQAQLEFSPAQTALGVFHVNWANVDFKFSGASLLCKGQAIAELECVGLWGDQPGDIAHVVFSVEPATNSVHAHFQTEIAYGQRAIDLACAITDQVAN